MRHLDFSPPDLKKFPCLRLAYEAAEAGGTKTVALNAADEVAVAAFLEHRLPFKQIAVVIERVLEGMPRTSFSKIDDVIAADIEARRIAREEVQRLHPHT